MPLLNHTDYKSFKGRLFVAAIYLGLAFGALTMVYPFLVTLTGSVSNPYDYERRAPFPRFLVSREDRLMRMLSEFYPSHLRQAMAHLRGDFPDLPADWRLWAQIGDNRQATDAWARHQLERLDNPDQRRAVEAAAADYAAFMHTWDLRETALAFNRRFVGDFLRERYGTLDAFNAAWQVAVDDFAGIRAAEWSGEFFDMPSYVQPDDDATLPDVRRRYLDLLAFKDAWRANRYTPALRGDAVTADYLRPATLRFTWEQYVRAVPERVALFGGAPLSFPLPADAPAPQKSVWHDYLRAQFPLRHVEVAVTPERSAAFAAFLRERFRELDYASTLLKREAARWEDFAFTATLPGGMLNAVWMDFVRQQVPPAEWTLRDTLPDLAFQRFALERHGSLDAINAAYSRDFAHIGQLAVPRAEAILATFAARGWRFVLAQAGSNYGAVTDYLFRRGRAAANTVILIVLTILINLTVNPLAGYALSRFRMRATEKVLVFCLMTMTFPVVVKAIPGFLLLRDLGLLNTFAALVLPTAANGMSIFMLKGFFDSLPQELYEAAAIDGAPEWQVFLRISMPLVKPILAVNMLHAFLAAYEGWAWALIVCQDPRMWTISVWTYQFSFLFASAPHMVMAAFVLTSLPVLLVFLFCQKIILRGIILPQMK